MTRTVVATTCTLDCPDSCSLAVTVEDGARVVAVEAGPGNPLTDGWICAKVRRHGDRVHSPDRVLTPLVRTGAKGAGEFRPASWDEALDLVAGRIRSTLDTIGGDGVVAFTYNSSAGRVERMSHSEALFAAIGATEVERTICAAIAGASWASVLDGMASADPLDVVHARLIVIWGANPTVSNTHFAPLVQQAKRNGARVVVVDPRRTAMAGRADLHLAVRPGTDVVLAHAIADRWRQEGRLDHAFLAGHAEGVEEFLEESARWPIERAAEICGVEADDIATLADWWGTTRPSMLRIGWGLERNANGGASYRAVLALPLLGGHVGERGAGVIGPTRMPGIDASRRLPLGTGTATRPQPMVGTETPQRRRVPMHRIGEWLAPDAGDPCEVLVIQGANPAVMCPDQDAVLTALARDDVFTVVHDQVLTDTARHADVVLPATTAFELDDIAIGYGSYTVGPVRRAIDRVGESRSNDELGLALARALGFDWPDVGLDPVIEPFGAEEPARQVVDGHVQFVDTRPARGRARLVDPLHGVPTWQPTGHGGRQVGVRGPLVLLSPASPKLVNSIFGESGGQAPTVSLHPDDAAERGITDGDRVRVHNDQGVVAAIAAVDDGVRPGVAVMPKGVWLRDHDEVDGVRRGVNVLTPAMADPLAGGACFNDTHVEITPA